MKYDRMTRWIHAGTALTANFMWVDIIGHSGMAIYHQWQGSPVITDRFNLEENNSLTIRTGGAIIWQHFLVIGSTEICCG